MYVLIKVNSGILRLVLVGSIWNSTNCLIGRCLVSKPTAVSKEHIYMYLHARSRSVHRELSLNILSYTSFEVYTYIFVPESR